MRTPFLATTSITFPFFSLPFFVLFFSSWVRSGRDEKPARWDHAVPPPPLPFFPLLDPPPLTCPSLNRRPGVSIRLEKKASKWQCDRVVVLHPFPSPLLFFFFPPPFGGFPLRLQRCNPISSNEHEDQRRPGRPWPTVPPFLTYVSPLPLEVGGKIRKNAFFPPFFSFLSPPKNGSNELLAGVQSCPPPSSFFLRVFFFP